jgi:hypothetical protein
MRKVLWTLLVVLSIAAVSGFVYAKVQSRSDVAPAAGGFICPLTGEKLPCPQCCPLNQGQPQQSYTCPETDEELPCPECCAFKMAGRASR